MDEHPTFQINSQPSNSIMGNESSKTITTQTSDTADTSCEREIIERVNEICSLGEEDLTPFPVFSRYLFFQAHLSEIFISTMLHLYGRGCNRGVIDVDLKDKDAKLTEHPIHHCSVDSLHFWQVSIEFSTEYHHANILLVDPSAKVSLKKTGFYNLTYIKSLSNALNQEVK